MSLTKHTAKHLRDIYFGGNWTSVNLKDTLSELSWKQATTKVYDFNTIATITFHATYYLTALIDVLRGKPLTAKDAYSFNLPPIHNQHDWEQLLNKSWSDAEEAVQLIEQLPDSMLTESFDDGKYGNCYRNIAGVIEHLHYHLGQIVIIKKVLLEPDKY